MNLNEIDYKKAFRKATEEIIIAIKNEYDISLDLSKESLPLFEKVLDKVKNLSGPKREEFEIGLSVYLTELLLKYFKGEFFKNDIGIGVKLYKTGLGKNIEIYPGAWVLKQLKNGRNDSIAFKFAVLSVAKKGKERKLTPKWPEDKVLAENFARRLKVPINDEIKVNKLIRDLLASPLYITKKLLEDRRGLIHVIKNNDITYKYFLGRVYKIHFLWQKLSSYIHGTNLRGFFNHFLSIKKYLHPMSFRLCWNTLKMFHLVLMIIFLRNYLT